MDTFQLTEEEKDLVLQHRRQKVEQRWRPKKSSEYSIEDKCLAFDLLHAMAMGIFKEVQSPDYCDDNDNEHWCFEAVMELLGKDVWKAYNEYLR